MPTSHFLAQVWEFPICGSAPAQYNRTTVILAVLLFMLSIMFMIPLCHSHEVLRIKSAPALARARQKRCSGSSRSVLCKPSAAPRSCSGRRQSERIPAASSCRFLLPLQVFWWGRWHQTSLELSAFSPAGSWDQSDVCVPSVPFQGVPVPAFCGLPCQHSHLAETCLLFQTGGRALTQPKHCCFSHWNFLMFLP